jgi:mRNA interferase RelE/StbE
LNWSIQIKASARKELARIEKSESLRIIAAIDTLAENPYRGSVLKGDLTGLRRLRIGNYRVIYELRDHELVVLVLTTGHRREVDR